MPTPRPIHRPPGWRSWEDRSAEMERKRPSSTARGYDNAWRPVRTAFIAANPVCSHPGCGKRATDVDHVRSVREAPTLRLEPTNLRPYCHGHHSARTARDQGWGRG